MDKTRLGEMLLSAGMLKSEQLRMAMDIQKAVGGKLGAIVVKLGFLDDETLTKFIAKQQDLPLVDISEMVLPENLIRRLPKEIIDRHQVIPIGFHDGILTLAMADPFDYDAIEEIQLAVDHRIEINIAYRAAIQKAIKEFLSAPAKPPPPPASREKSKEEMIRELEDEGPEPAGSPLAGLPPAKIRRALIRVLVQKGVLTEEETARKAKELP